MSRPLSSDLRERVVVTVIGGESCRAAATRFGVAVSSVVKWSQRHRATGSVAPGKMGGDRKPVLEPHRAFIKERISQTPHLTLHKLKDELAARGVKVSHNTVWMFLRREGLGFKKNTIRPSSRRALTLRTGVAADGRGKPAWFPGASSSSTRPGSRPAWPRYAGGDRRASGCGVLPRTAIGRR
jgi:putative transposase